MSGIDRLLGERIRVWDAQHDRVFVEGRCITVSLGRVVFVETECGCGERKIAAQAKSLPIDVLTWQPA